MTCSPKVLGVVLAGGRSSRFGSDKALAELGGRTLLDNAIVQLSRWCDAVAVAGRDWRGVTSLDDWPKPDMGPLGGIAAGLRHARILGFSSVFTCAVDSFDLPGELFGQLHPAPAFVADQPVIGHWPVEALAVLEGILGGDGRKSMLAFATAIDAREVALERPPANINNVVDLEEARKRLRS